MILWWLQITVFLLGLLAQWSDACGLLCVVFCQRSDWFFVVTQPTLDRRFFDNVQRATKMSCRIRGKNSLVANNSGLRVVTHMKRVDSRICTWDDVGLFSIMNFTVFRTWGPLQKNQGCFLKTTYYLVLIDWTVPNVIMLFENRISFCYTLYQM
jgi:hypothetical protein